MNRQAIETILAQAGSRWDTRTGAVTMPIYQTTTFAHAKLGHSTGFDYSRTANPTRSALEATLAAAEGGDGAFAFASGLAAVDALIRLLQPGDHIVVTEDLYGGTYRLFDQVSRPAGITPIFVDTSDTDATAQAIREHQPKAVFVESPTNPLLKIADLPALAEHAHAAGALLVVDNTFMTAYQQQPFEQGADLIIYSASKYLAGHNDVVAGAVVTRTPELTERIGFIQNAVGAILGPMDAWLILRGLKTLPLRLNQQAANALQLATWLQQHPAIARVFYPGLADHPHRDRLPAGGGHGGMIAVELNDAARVPHILENLRVFLFAESLGGVESLLTYPLVQTHADMDAALLERLGINDRLLRLSIGVEHINDLIADLEHVL
jgi:cystathionine gamma-synthase